MAMSRFCWAIDADFLLEAIDRRVLAIFRWDFSFDGLYLLMIAISTFGMSSVSLVRSFVRSFVRLGVACKQQVVWKGVD